MEAERGSLRGGPWWAHLFLLVGGPRVPGAQLPSALSLRALPGVQTPHPPCLPTCHIPARVV